MRAHAQGAAALAARVEALEAELEGAREQHRGELQALGAELAGVLEVGGLYLSCVTSEHCSMRRETSPLWCTQRQG